jgi:flagellar protein FliS
MGNAENYRNHLEAKVLEANPVELVRMLYRAALESVGQARLCLRQGDIRGRSQAIGKCSAILAELALSLDVANGGAVARSLTELYDYMQRLLSEANFRQAEDPLAETARLMATLLEGWENCALETPATPAAHERVPATGYDRAPEYKPVAQIC